MAEDFRMSNHFQWLCCLPYHNAKKFEISVPHFVKKLAHSHVEAVIGQTPLSDNTLDRHRNRNPKPRDLPSLPEYMPRKPAPTTDRAVRKEHQRRSRQGQRRIWRRVIPSFQYVEVVVRRVRCLAFLMLHFSPVSCWWTISYEVCCTTP